MTSSSFDIAASDDALSFAAPSVNDHYAGQMGRRHAVVAGAIGRSPDKPMRSAAT